MVQHDCSSLRVMLEMQATDVITSSSFPVLAVIVLTVIHTQTTLLVLGLAPTHRLPSLLYRLSLPQLSATQFIHTQASLHPSTVSRKKLRPLYDHILFITCSPPMQVPLRLRTGRGNMHRFHPQQLLLDHCQQRGVKQTHMDCPCLYLVPLSNC
jgi:hypothetical protein